MLGFSARRHRQAGVLNRTDTAPIANARLSFSFCSYSSYNTHNSLEKVKVRAPIPFCAVLVLPSFAPFVCLLRRPIVVHIFFSRDSSLAHVSSCHRQPFFLFRRNFFRDVSAVKWKSKRKEKKVDTSLLFLSRVVNHRSLSATWWCRKYVWVVAVSSPSSPPKWSAWKIKQTSWKNKVNVENKPKRKKKQLDVERTQHVSFFFTKHIRNRDRVTCWETNPNPKPKPTTYTHARTLSCCCRLLRRRRRAAFFREWRQCLFLE